MKAQAGSGGAARKVGYGKGGGKGTPAYGLSKEIKRSMKKAAATPYTAVKKAAKKGR